VPWSTLGLGCGAGRVDGCDGAGRAEGCCGAGRAEGWDDGGRDVSTGFHVPRSFVSHLPGLPGLGL